MWFIKNVDGAYIAIQKTRGNLTHLETTKDIAQAKRFDTKTKAEKWVKPLLRFWGVGQNPEFVFIE